MGSLGQMRHQFLIKKALPGRLAPSSRPHNPCGAKELQALPGLRLDQAMLKLPAAQRLSMGVPRVISGRQLHALSEVVPATLPVLKPRALHTGRKKAAGCALTLRPVAPLGHAPLQVAAACKAFYQALISSRLCCPSLAPEAKGGRQQISPASCSNEISAPHKFQPTSPGRKSALQFLLLRQNHCTLPHVTIVCIPLSPAHPDGP
jgi:hypothetical protein